MKLFELDATRQTKQAAKVFESYFGSSISFDSLTKKQASVMLNRVRGLIAEHRSQPSFHTSEQNPSYMKLVVMEQGLAAKVREAITPGGGATANQPAGTAPVAAPGAAPMNPADAQKQQAAMVLQQQQRKRQTQEQIKQKQQELQALQKQLTMPMAESRLVEGSDVQQAQVVLASQDMVDQVQKMIEQVTSMQFKDLPALVDQVKNQVGPDQAVQFNQEATGAFTTLTQNLQASKTQLDQALGVVTGQGAVVPGEDMATPTPDLGAEELPAEPVDGEEEIDIDADIEEPAGGSVNDLGRKRR